MIEAYTTNLILSYILAAAIGAIIGSFLNVIIYRLPIMLEREWQQTISVATAETPFEPKKNSSTNAITKRYQVPTHRFNLIWPRSHCIYCKHLLYLRDNIPVISYFLLMGCCRFCKQNISKQYPIVELLTILITIIIFSHFGFNVATCFTCLFAWSLIALSVIDYNTQLLPDYLTLPLLWTGLLLSVFQLFIPANEAILAAITGYLILWFPAQIFQFWRKKPGMGNGDFKLLAAIGAWLGIIPLVNVLCIAVIIGLVTHIILLIRKKIYYNQLLPFGPALALAGGVVLIWGPIITNFFN